MSNIIATDLSRSSDISLEPAIDPSARPTFLLDWELTLKCNLDCTYCNSGPDGYHWNSAPHPEYEDCLRTIDFFYKYTDEYMKYKAPWTRHAVLNIYGGESLIYPDIVKVLEQVREKYKPYQDRWSLKVTCTTNGIVKPKVFHRVTELIDEFTMSFHTENTAEQKEMFQNNLFYLKEKNKDFKCVVLMHNDPVCWDLDLEFIKFCDKNNLRYLPRQLDGDNDRLYSKKQLQWFNNFYNSQQKTDVNLDSSTEKNLSKEGRACCGGRKICTNGNMRNPDFFIYNNNFQNWFCSVNWMFVYVRQFSKEIFTNKDCKMSFGNTVAPIGHLDYYEELINWTKENLSNNTMPVIQCAKTQCWCGLCAPKASTKSNFDNIIKKHITQDVFEK